jgi:hypothetical protein
MISKQEYLNFWNFKPEEEEAAWAAKVAFDQGQRVFAAPMVFVKPDIHYESPIDGRVISSKQQRLDDLARSGCIEYDPEMKTDAARRRQESDKILDKAVETTVEQAFEKMPVQKKERLTNELLGGITAEPVRLTAGG